MKKTKKAAGRAAGHGAGAGAPARGGDGGVRPEGHYMESGQIAGQIAACEVEEITDFNFHYAALERCVPVAERLFGGLRL